MPLLEIWLELSPRVTVLNHQLVVLAPQELPFLEIYSMRTPSQGAPACVRSEGHCCVSLLLDKLPRQHIGQ